ncbi:MAG: DEAD/DEAH box helicase [Gammaproteobacteria bacterium]
MTQTQDQAHLSDIEFRDLALDESILRGATDKGFTRCTHIQAGCLPLALKGRDVAGQAQTGTGKTAAFLLALFQRLIDHPAPLERKPTQPRAMILAPTRELAVQIARDAKELGQHLGFRIGLVYGGVDYEKQRLMLERGVDILIGTPGRLIDYYKQRVFDLHQAQVMVLDEADRMFDLGFIKDIRYILRKLPPPTQRLNMLFSATLSHRVMELAYEHMNDPEFVRVDPDRVTVDLVRQLLYMPGSGEKIPLLIGLLKHMDPTRTMVFVNTKRGADKVAAYLEGNGFGAAVLSGDVPQKKRLRLLSDFQAGRLPILVTTDVASRGLHVPDVSHVFNYDLPQDAEDYVHRIGRTARAGADGDAISFACEEFSYSLPEIESFIGHEIPRGSIDENLLVKPRPPAPIQRRNKPPSGRRGDKPSRHSGKHRSGKQ